jgi:hypothetical protein
MIQSPKFSTAYVNDLMQDPDVLGLNIANATPKVRELIGKWALKEELKAAEEERFEDAIKYRDILKSKTVFVRKIDNGFEILEYVL